MQKRTTTVQDRAAREDDLLDDAELEHRLRTDGMLDAALSDPEAFLDVTEWADPGHAE